jgi:hypothetical protein
MPHVRPLINAVHVAVEIDDLAAVNAVSDHRTSAMLTSRVNFGRDLGSGRRAVPAAIADDEGVLRSEESPQQVEEALTERVAPPRQRRLRLGKGLLRCSAVGTGGRLSSDFGLRHAPSDSHTPTPAGSVSTVSAVQERMK